MTINEIKRLLEKVSSGNISTREAIEKLKNLPFERLTNSHIDHHRHLRQGIPEVILAEGKTTDDVVKIARSIYKQSGRLLITRASEEVKKKLRIRAARYYPVSRIIMASEERKKIGSVLVLSAGTSDLSVAEEASLTASFLGSRVETIFDVGVAGIHRLFNYKEKIDSANVLIVVAGMEGALPSVVGGLTDKVIIAVPTSTGYGTSFGGLTALFSMLNSCVPGIAVVNIDNGFGAGCLAHKINSLCSRADF